MNLRECDTYAQETGNASSQAELAWWQHCNIWVIKPLSVPTDLKHALWCHVANLAIGRKSGNHPVVAQHILLCNGTIHVNVRLPKACSNQPHFGGVAFSSYAKLYHATGALRMICSSLSLEQMHALHKSFVVHASGLKCMLLSKANCR